MIGEPSAATYAAAVFSAATSAAGVDDACETLPIYARSIFEAYYFILPANTCAEGRAHAPW